MNDLQKAVLANLDARPMTPAEAAAHHHVSARRMQALARQGRIPGAMRVAGDWHIPPGFTITPPPVRPGRRLAKIVVT